MTTSELLCLVATIDWYSGCMQGQSFPSHFELLVQQASRMTLGIATIARNGIRRPFSIVTLSTRSQQAPQERAPDKFVMRP